MKKNKKVKEEVTLVTNPILKIPGAPGTAAPSKASDDTKESSPPIVIPVGGSVIVPGSHASLSSKIKRRTIGPSFLKELREMREKGEELEGGGGGGTNSMNNGSASSSLTNIKEKWMDRDKIGGGGGGFGGGDLRKDKDRSDSIVTTVNPILKLNPPAAVNATAGAGSTTSSSTTTPAASGGSAIGTGAPTNATVTTINPLHNIHHVAALATGGGAANKNVLSFNKSASMWDGPLPSTISLPNNSGSSLPRPAVPAPRRTAASRRKSLNLSMLYANREILSNHIKEAGGPAQTGQKHTKEAEEIISPPLPTQQTDIVPHASKLAAMSREGPSFLRVFGCPLEAVIRLQKCSSHSISYKRPHLLQPISPSAESSRLNIPFAMKLCIHYLIRNGLSAEGIFRLSGQLSDVTELKERLDAMLLYDENETLDKIEDPHIVASVMKQYLRQLPVPLLTYALSDDLCAALEKENPESAVRELIEKLPRANQHLLQGLFILVDQIVANSKYNMMGPENMSTVLGPSLLWQENQGRHAADFSLDLLTRANTLTDFMVHHHAALFPAPASSFGISSSPEVATLQRKLVGYTRSVQCMALVPSQNTIWGGDNGGKIYIHNSSTLLVVKELSACNTYLTCLLPVENSVWASTASSIIVLNAEDGECKTEISGGSHCLARVGNTIWSGGEGSIVVYDCQSAGVVKEIPSPGGAIYCMAHYKDQMWCGYKDKVIRVYNTQNFELVKELSGFKRKLRKIEVAQDALWVASDDHAVSIWDPHAFKQLHQIELRSSVYDLALVEGEVWCCTRDKRVILWDAATYEYVGDLPPFHTDSVGTIHAYHDQRRNHYQVWTASFDRSTIVWGMTEPTKHGRQASRNAYAIRNQNRKPSKEDAAARFAAAASGDPLLAENNIPNKNAGNAGGEETSSGGLRRTRSEDFTFPSMDKVDKPAAKEEKKDSAKEKDNTKESTKEPQQQHRGKSEPRGPPSVRDKAGTMIIGRKSSMDERQYRVRSEENVEAPKEELQARDKDHRRDTAKGNESRVRRRADSGTSLGSSGRRPTIEGRASIVLVDLFNVVIAPADSLGTESAETGIEGWRAVSGAVVALKEMSQCGMDMYLWCGTVGPACGIASSKGKTATPRLPVLPVLAEWVRKELGEEWVDRLLAAPREALYSDIVITATEIPYEKRPHGRSKIFIFEPGTTAGPHREIRRLKCWKDWKTTL